MPARPQAQTQGGRISPSVTITYSDLVQKSLRKAPGPGAYESTHSLGDDMHPATKFSTLALQSSFVTKAGKMTPEWRQNSKQPLGVNKEQSHLS